MRFALSEEAKEQWGTLKISEYDKSAMALQV